MRETAVPCLTAGRTGREGNRKGARAGSSWLANSNETVRPCDLTKWQYNSPQFRRQFNSGNYKVDIDHAINNFFSWLSVDYLLTFNNESTNESFETISPKRGNKQFAIKKWKKVREINKGMSGLQFDFNIPNTRGLKKKCHLFLVTLTFKQNITREEAWHKISSHGGELNRFRANLTKIFGSKATITVKEAQSNGYPAPHILILLDKPEDAIRHYGKKGISWRINSRRIIDRMKSIWGWGFLDVEAVVFQDSGKYRGYRSPISYLTKYLTKSLDLSEHPDLLNAKGLDDIPKNLHTPVYTHIWNKILCSRDFYISKAFKNRLNGYIRLSPAHTEITQKEKWQLIDCEFVPHSHILHNRNQTDKRKIT